MYNIGIILSKGRIITICDSDAIVKPTFIESIIKAFEEDSNIVVHMDEVRNINKKFYPFNYPTIEEVISEGCINFKNGKTTGILDKEDPLHTRNYGACMSALREDLINIGGADEHIDYLGHICGPYELTFRLVNAGKKEIWHEKEFSYHTWHPGTDGSDNYLGPHDGRNMSTTALEARRKDRVMPLVENSAIKMLRLGGNYNLTEDLLFSKVIRDVGIKNWAIDENKRLISLGRAAYYKGNYDEAIKLWKKVLGNLSPDSVFLCELGWAYYFRSEYNEALTIFNKAVKLDPLNQYILRGRGWTYLQINSFDEAIKDFNIALQNVSTQDKDFLQEIFRGLGWAYFHKGCFDEAIQNFIKSIKNTNVNNREILKEIFGGIGSVCIKMGEFGQAKQYLDRAIENINFNNKGVLEDAIGGREIPSDSLPKTCEKTPCKSEYNEDVRGIKSSLLSDMGWAYYLKANYNEALINFNEAINYYTKNHRALCGRGWTYLHKSRFDEAIKDFNFALEYIDPTDKNGLQEALRGRGWAYYHSGSFKEAIEDFNMAGANTDENDKNVLRHIFRGRSWGYYRMGRMDKAIEDFKRTGVSPLVKSNIMARVYLSFQVLRSLIKQSSKRI
jgi:tetratricopeptide (TPR) repeat protein